MNSETIKLEFSTDEENGRCIVNTLSFFGIVCELRAIHHGPSVTLYELSLDVRNKISSILSLNDRLAMVLEVDDVRILAPIPGKNAIGVEVPNKERTVVKFESIFDSLKSEDGRNIPIVLGKDVYSNPIVIDLTGCPHLLIGGSEESGKTTFIDSLICSIFCNRTPDDVRLILIDTKEVELSVYNGMPHLLVPVISDISMAMKALDYVVRELERRIKLLTEARTRRIEEYNGKNGRITVDKKLPYLVVIIDDFADLILAERKEFETIIKRLTTSANLCGIHLVISTKRVTPDVVTGVVKSNFPSQIAFAVPSGINSRILIDQIGAEKLLGSGDLFYNSYKSRFPVRIQGAMIDSGVDKYIESTRRKNKPCYLDELIF